MGKEYLAFPTIAIIESQSSFECQMQLVFGENEKLVNKISKAYDHS